MNTKVVVMISIGLILISSCIIKQKESHVLSVTKKSIYEKLSGDTLCVLSPDKKYSLYYKKPIDADINPNALMEFLVINNTNGVIIYEDKIAGAKVTWKSATELYIKVQNGIIVNPQDNGKVVFVYDVIKNSKYKLKSLPDN